MMRDERDEAFLQGRAEIRARALAALEAIPAKLRQAGDPTPEEIADCMEWQEAILTDWARDAIRQLALAVYGGVPDPDTRH